MQYKARSIATIGALSCTFFGMDAAAIDTRFTYTSDAIEWESSKLYGDDYVLDNDVSPVFTVSFLLPGNWLTLSTPTTFTIPNQPDITLSNYTRPSTFGPNAINSVTVGQNGDVTHWNFSFAFDPVFVPTGNPLDDAVDKLVNSRAKIFSKYGPALCDCDVVQMRYNTATILSGGHPFLIGPVEVNYRDGNLPSNWSLSLVSAVPEPSTYLMMLGGLALLGALAKKQKRLPHARLA
ncbi:MAG TPA: PEP-CTERM sorting domain-containing protein [Oxalicibacterium sp.]|nr:PEP-CTERM sorting domain-containing protein [Oxalicibacterium sp.]